MRYSRRLPSALRKSLSISLTESQIRETTEFADGSLALDEAGTQKLSFDYLVSRAELAAIAQNRALYAKVIRDLFGKPYWELWDYINLLAVLIQHGAYAWLAELCQMYLITKLHLSFKCRLLTHAIIARDPAIVRMMLDNGAIVTRGVIIDALDWVSGASLCPNRETGFETPEAERAYLIQTQQEIVDLLSPFEDAYPGTICSEGLTVDQNPGLFDNY